MKNKVKKLKWKVDPDGAVIEPTYEQLVKTTNLHLDLTDNRTKARDKQITNLKEKMKYLNQEISDYKREMMEYHNLLMKQKSGLEKFNELLEGVRSLYEYQTDQIAKIKKKIGIK